MNRSTPGLPVHYQLPEFTQTHGRWVSDAIQPSQPLSSPSPPMLLKLMLLQYNINSKEKSLADNLDHRKTGLPWNYPSESNVSHRTLRTLSQEQGCPVSVERLFMRISEFLFKLFSIFTKETFWLWSFFLHNWASVRKCCESAFCMLEKPLTPFLTRGISVSLWFRKPSMASFLVNPKGNQL